VKNHKIARLKVLIKNNISQIAHLSEWQVLTFTLFSTTLAFVPQLVLILKTRSTRDISLGTFLTMTTGVFLWFVYGLLIGDGPVIAANGITFLLSLSIVVLKLRG
jgi:MtN3 and saliva related transmembrane protein